jgi:hypothetical protein
MTYEEQIASFLHAHLTTAEPNALPILAQALGCRTRKLLWSCNDDAPTQPDLIFEPLVVETLLTALRHHIGSRNDDSNGESILNGLLKNNRWRACLESIEDAYNFVFIVACSYTHFENDKNRKNKNELQAHNIEPLRKVVIKWFGLSEAEGEHMTTALFLERTFGSLWCEFALAEDMLLGDIVKIVSDVHPPFMPDVLPAHFQLVSQPLPSFEMP